jgi:hypothetical protein
MLLLPTDAARRRPGRSIASRDGKREKAHRIDRHPLRNVAVTATGHVDSPKPPDGQLLSWWIVKEVPLWTKMPVPRAEGAYLSWKYEGHWLYELAHLPHPLHPNWGLTKN